MIQVNVIPKTGDKNFGIEVVETNGFDLRDRSFFPAAVIRDDKVRDGKFFVQCHTSDYVFLESWQDSEDVVLECALYLERVYGT